MSTQQNELPTPPTEVIEQDTIEREDIPNVVQFVLPSADIQQSAISLGLSINHRIFSGWVKQPSPCCGAASVAGAWNCLHGLHRRNPNALNHENVIDAYCSLFTDKIYQHIKSFERRLGAPIDLVIIAIQEELKLVGREIGGRKKAGATAKTVASALKTIIRRHLSSAEIQKTANDGEGIESMTSLASFQMNPLDCLRDLFALEGIDLAAAVDTSDIVPDVTVSASDPADEENSEESESEGEEQPPAVEVKKGKKSSSAASTTWNWRKDLMSIIKNLGGLKKLMSSKPNTAPVGNWAVLQVVKRVSEWADIGTRFQARLFMGKSRLKKHTGLDIALSAHDSEDTITSQWGALRTAFSRQDTALLFHLKNHYALIFALREYAIPVTSQSPHQATNSSSKEPSSPSSFVEELRQTVAASSSTITEAAVDVERSTSRGKLPESSISPSVIDSNRGNAIITVRQILCARKGQRPTAWVDFDEARATMLGWEGYKIMALTLAPDTSAPDPRSNSGFEASSEAVSTENPTGNSKLGNPAFNCQAEIQKQSDSHEFVIDLMNRIGLLPSHY